MQDALYSIVCDINTYLSNYILVFLLIAVGLWYSIKTKFVQVRYFKEGMKNVFGNIKLRGEKQESGMTSFQALATAIAAQVGTGNIVGASGAILTGGPGAIFWMWIIAFFGASTAYVESTLAQMYKFRHESGYRGGPFCYIEQGLKCKWLAIVLAVFTIIGLGILCPQIQSNSIAMATDNVFNIPVWVSGLFVTILLGIVIIGGVRRIAKVAEFITPFMAIIYIVLSIAVMVINWRQIPYVFGMIFKGAFGIYQVGGGILGSTIAMGVKRGLYSNEAGEGTGAIVSASADVERPENQGLVQAFSVYIDTLLVCSATAFMILSTGMYNVIDMNTGEMLQANAPELGNNYVGYTQAAVNTIYSGFGSGFVTVALFFFAFTTIMAYYFYSETSIMYLTKKNKRSEKITIWIYRFVILASVMFGSLKSADLAWILGDIGIGMTTWINVIVILILAPKATKLVK